LSRQEIFAVIFPQQGKLIPNFFYCMAIASIIYIKEFTVTLGTFCSNCLCTEIILNLHYDAFNIHRLSAVYCCEKWKLIIQHGIILSSIHVSNHGRHFYFQSVWFLPNQRCSFQQRIQHILRKAMDFNVCVKTVC
jgi:hypothetical protein